jgi:serine/threonine-protein kinase
MAETRTAGRYELQDELGRGAMGIVYKAYDPRIGRPVAVKTMRLTEVGTGMKHEELVARFDIETKAAGRLTHPNIVVIYDAGEDNGVFYITMELVTGRSLQSLVDSKQVFPLPRVMRIMEQAGSALDFAHQNSVVHRDIKPANLLLTPDDTVKVTDFGTAKILQKGATQTGAILGTPSYMSPEQVKGKPVDGRSDIFSLGVILYELVTGEKPFPGQNVTTVIYKIVNEEPIPPREIDNSVHAGLSYVIMRALSKEPDVRYQSCKDLVDDLKNYKALGGGTESATIVMPGRQRPKEVQDAIARMAATTQATSPATSAKVEPAAPPRPPAPRPVTLPPLTGALPRTAEEPPSRTGLWVTISIILLGVLGGGGYLLWPELQQNFNKGREQLAKQSQSAPASQPSAPADAASGAPAESTPAGAPGKGEAPAAAPAKAEPAAELTPQARLQEEIRNRLAAAGLGNRVRADVRGRDVVLTGTLTAQEARQLRTRFQRLPGKLRLVDRIQIGRAPAAATSEPSSAEERPKPAPGKGELEVITDQLGATVVLRGPDGQAFPPLKTPDRFENLAPGRYTMDITLDGYRPVKNIVNITAGNITVKEISMQPVGGGLIVDSSPPQADVLINGQPRGVTPMTLQLSPGRYTLAVQKTGYQSYSGTVQVGADKLERVDVTLTRATRATQAQAPAPPAAQPAGPGWVEVRTIPPGADILVDNASTGKKTPARLELRPGTYTLTLFLRGYRPVQKQVRVEANQTLPLNEALPRQ